MLNTVKEEMRQLVLQSLAGGNSEEVNECLQIYKKTYGEDEFYVDSFRSMKRPPVTVIAVHMSDEKVDAFVKEQAYTNLEVVRVYEEDSYQDIVDFMRGCESKYICFIEENQYYYPDKINKMVDWLEAEPNVDLTICAREFVDSEKSVVAHGDAAYRESLKNKFFNGKAFVEFCISNKVNLYGTLSTLMVRTDLARKIPFSLVQFPDDKINRLSFLYGFFLNGYVGYMDEVLVASILEIRDDNRIEEYYSEYIQYLNKSGILNISEIAETECEQRRTEIAKHITFFYTDKGEYYNLKPIADAAVKRGYEVVFTENLTQKAEIGVYCQHVCYPENARFSVILLHDMAQGHNRWPNIWEIERWDKFDIGILPGKSWGERWSECACMNYVNPRCGAYELGYPKSDLITENALSERCEELKKQFGLKYDFSVLYAPSWENDEKEDDFVRALASLPVNLLIKQAHWPVAYSHIIHNIEQMRKQHEGKYPNVYYIEPEESIMTALKMCDMVVSDESSVMAEALLFGKPSVAVYDWLIPDTYPSRFAEVPMDYVLKCKRVELREYVEKLSTDATFYEAALGKGEHVFSNHGTSCRDILDAIEYFAGNGTNKDFLEKKLEAKYAKCSMWN
ncbi:MAG: CDP-glycerol glycerophosphotransferase family protein [Lachnospiraceae bacterium]|nr:CDP-glycerol glycerophosphotransferase family protein [Lachnospiraceae bacterium]